MQKSRPRKKKARIDDSVAFESLTGAPKQEQFLLKLYVVGATTRSTRAIKNIKQICEEHLDGNYELEIIDIYKNPKMVREDQIIAAPTLLKKKPLPLRRLVGDLSDKKRILLILELDPNTGKKG